MELSIFEIRKREVIIILLVGQIMISCIWTLFRVRFLFAVFAHMLRKCSFDLLIEWRIGGGKLVGSTSNNGSPLSPSSTSAFNIRVRV